MQPAFKLVVDGKDRTADIAVRLIKLQIKDQAGFKSDSLSLSVDDADGVLELPRKGAVIEASLGYQETGLKSFGKFTVDEVEVSGPPATMVIRAKAADMRQGLKELKSRSWDQVTIGDLVSSIAAEHELMPKVSADYAQDLIAHIDQTDESDMNLLTRIAKERGALVKVANNNLVMVPISEAKTVSGKKLEAVTINLSDATKWSATFPDRGRYLSVVASWGDIESGALQEVTAGQGEPVFRLRNPYPTQADASEAAKAKLKALNHSEAKLSITLPGNPDLLAETPLSLVGFRSGVAAEWVVNSVVHSYSPSGYSVSVQAE